MGSPSHAGLRAGTGTPLFGTVGGSFSVTKYDDRCQGKCVGERVGTGCGDEVVHERIERNLVGFSTLTPNKEEFFRMKVTMLSLMAAIPLITLSAGSVSAFAQSPAAVSQHLSQGSSVTPSTSSATASSQPVVNTNLPAPIAKKLPMPPADLQQTISTVNRYIQHNAQGLAHIRVAQLRQAGLSPHEIRWAQAQITRYNTKIANGTLTPVHIAESTKPVSVSRASTDMVANTAVTSMSTGNLSYGWFVASTPYTYTANYWWGQSTIFNELATSKTEGVLWVLDGTSAGIAYGATKLSFIPYADAVAFLTTVGAIGFTIEAGAMQAADNGYGDHLNELWSGVPLGIYGNTP